MPHPCLWLVVWSNSLLLELGDERHISQKANIYYGVIKDKGQTFLKAQ